MRAEEGERERERDARAPTRHRAMAPRDERDKGPWLLGMSVIRDHGS